MNGTNEVNLDFFHLIQQGAISTYPLIACSIVVLCIVFERMYALRGTIQSTVSLTGKLVPILARGDVDGAVSTIRGHHKCPARRVFEDVVTASSSASVEDLERVADERQFEEAQGAGAYLWLLGTIGSAAPFIGLFGTVVGIIRAFHSMALAGTGGFAVVASGISEALIATALGLAIGIVAVVCYNYFQSRVERIDAALRIGSARVIEALSAGRKTHAVR
jgi:biopolymer transport protein ExbB